MKIFVFLHVDTDSGGFDQITFRGISIDIKDGIKHVHPESAYDIPNIRRTAVKDPMGNVIYNCKDKGDSYLQIIEAVIDDMDIVAGKTKDLVPRKEEGPSEVSSKEGVLEKEEKPEVDAYGDPIETKPSATLPKPDPVKRTPKKALGEDGSISIKFG